MAVIQHFGEMVNVFVEQMHKCHHWQKKILWSGKVRILSAIREEIIRQLTAAVFRVKSHRCDY